MKHLQQMYREVSGVPAVALESDASVAEATPVVIVLDEDAIKDAVVEKEIVDAIKEADDSARDIDEMSDSVERLSEIGVGLEGLVYALEGFQETGIDASSAHFLNLAASAYTTQLGMESAPVAAMESFGGQSSRVEMTKYSMEAIGDVAKNVWKTVSKFLADLVAASLDFVKKSITASGRLKTRNEQISAMASKVSGAQSTDKIALGTVAKSLAINGSVPANLLIEFDHVVETADQVLNGFSKSCIVTLKDFSQVSKTVMGQLVAGATRDAADVAVNEAIAKINLPVFPGANVSVSGAGSKRTRELLGSQAIFVHMEGEGVAAVKNYSVTMEKVSDRAPTSDAVSPMKATDVKRLTASIEKLISEIEGWEATVKSWKSEFDSLTATSGAAFATADNDDKAAAASVVNGASRSVVQALARMINNPAIPFIRYSMNTANTLLGVASKSLRQYETAPANVPATA